MDLPRTKCILKIYMENKQVDIMLILDIYISDLGQDASMLGINESIIDDPLGQGFTCALCGKGFGVNKHHCRRHIKNFHRKHDISLSCNVCQKSYKNYDSLRHHQRTSHGLYKQ